MSTTRVYALLSSAADTISNSLTYLTGGNVKAETSNAAININYVFYDPRNEQHHTFINEQIKLYTERFDALWNIDKKVGMYATADFILWFSGVFGMGLSLAGGVGLYFYANQYLSRQQYVDSYQEQLGELIKIYFWCKAAHVDTNNVLVEKDEKLLAPYFKLLEILAPVMNAKDLELLDLYHKNIDHPNPKLKEILSKPPHQFPFPKEKSGGKSLLENNKFYRFFEQSLPHLQGIASEATRVFYGYEPKNEDRISFKRLK